MLSKERLRYIIQRLEADQAVSVTTLSREMEVSLSTVQRDLRKLVAEGKIEREHGGAITNDFAQMLSSRTEESVDKKTALHKQQKQHVASVASQVIEDGDCIFVDSGTTTAYMVPYIRNRNITIVTNSLYLVAKLRGCKAKVVVLGGTYDSKYDMNSGSITLQAIRQFQFDRCFISANGWNTDTHELFSVESENGIIKESVMEQSVYNYLLIDSSKFDVRAMYVFANEDAFTQIYVDCYLKGKNKKITICKERGKDEDNGCKKK